MTKLKDNIVPSYLYIWNNGVDNTFSNDWTSMNRPWIIIGGNKWNLIDISKVDGYGS